MVYSSIMRVSSINLTKFVGSTKITTHLLPSCGFKLNQRQVSTTIEPNSNSNSNSPTPSQLSTSAIENTTDNIQIANQLDNLNLTDQLLSNHNNIIHDQSITITSTPDDYILSKYLFVDNIQNWLYYFQDSLHIPYYGSIIILPFVAKFFWTLPIRIMIERRQSRIVPHIETAMYEYRELSKDYFKTRDKERFQTIRKELENKYGFNPITAVVPYIGSLLLQIPVHLACYIALNTMYFKYNNYDCGGILWFKNLAIYDETWILPICVGIMGCISIDINRRITEKAQKNGINSMGMYASSGLLLRQEKGLILGTMMVGSMIFLPPISHLTSAGVNLYVIANMASFLVQNGLIHDKKMKQMFEYADGSKYIQKMQQDEKEKQTPEKVMSRPSVRKRRK